MPRLLEEFGDFELQICYSLRELAKILKWNHQKLKRHLDKEDVHLHKGKIWLTDIRDRMPRFYEGLIEVIRQKHLGKKILEQESRPKSLYEQEMEQLL